MQIARLMDPSDLLGQLSEVSLSLFFSLVSFVYCVEFSIVCSEHLQPSQQPS